MQLTSSRACSTSAVANQGARPCSQQIVHEHVFYWCVYICITLAELFQVIPKVCSQENMPIK